MKKEIFFSIILPIYNVEKYLDRCIESILSQNFENLEIILVDDESPDSCPHKCDEWKEKDSRIQVIHKKNGGLGYARNSGLELAKGKYIWFIDSDDAIVPGSLKKIHSHIMKNDSPDVIFFGYKRVNKTGKIEFEEIQNIEKKEFQSNIEIVNELLPDFIFSNPNSEKEINVCKSAWCCCIKNKIIQDKKIKFESERKFISEDYYFWLDNFDKFTSMVFVNDIFYLYYQNEDSLSLQYRSDRFEKIKDFDLQLEKLIIAHDYPKECKIRIKGLFISNLLGCLKSEIRNRKKVGFYKSYKRFKKICKDKSVYNAVKVYPCKNKGIGWQIFSTCILNKMYLLLYVALLKKKN